VRFNIGNAKTSQPLEGSIANLKLKLLEQVSEVMRFKHYSLRTERTYRDWIKRFILDWAGSTFSLRLTFPATREVARCGGTTPTSRACSAR
jgi:hypothetical protein